MGGERRPFDAVVANRAVWLLPLLCVLSLVVAYIGKQAGHPLLNENGPFENLQILGYLIGMVVLIRAAKRGTALAPALWVGVVLYLNLAVRELDLRPLGAPTWLVDVTFTWSPYWTGLLWLIALGYAWIRRKTLVPALRAQDWRPTRRLVGVVIGVVLLVVLSGERWVIHSHANREFAEEVLELPSSFGLLLLALVLAYKSRHPSSEA